MKKGLWLLVSALAFLATISPLHADDWNYHPGLTDRFTVAVGAFRSSNTFKLRANGEDVNTDIDFNDALGVSDSGTLVNAQLRWRFGSTKKWSLWGQYFSSDFSGTATLTEDVEWQDVTFGEGTFVSAGVGFDIGRLFIGRSFILNDQQDFGAGIGVHNLDLSAFIEGEVIINDVSSGDRKVKTSASQILPNIGAWYQFAPAKRWLLHARLDWIGASVGDYDGSMWNAVAGVNFQAWRHFGFDLSWQYFNLDVNVKKSDWTGGAELIYNGPVISVTSSW